jgi:GT2 family glycosyltransferase
MKIGLVTVLYNSDKMLEDFFQSISIQTYRDFFLVLVDNSPNENSQEIVRNLEARYSIVLTYLQMQSNIGVAAANNVGIKTCLNNKCDAILLLNNDIKFTQTNCFETLVNLAITEKIIVTKLTYFDSNVIWYAGGLFRNWFGFVKHIGIGKQKSIAKYNIAKHTFYAPTCFAFILKEVFNNVGLMDEQYFVYVDDIDFMYRAKKANYNIWYEPSIVIEHKISQSTGGMTSDFSLYYDTRNKIYYSKKFNSLPNKISSIFFIISLGFLFAFREKRKSAQKAVINAIKDGFKMKIADL